MISNKKYIILSLELHLFFARIMKEHAIFLEAGFTPKNSKLAKEADCYKQKFEELLLDTVKLSEGVIREEVLESGEFFTDYTLSTERKTEHFTGIKINEKITMMELRLHCEKHKYIKSGMIKDVKQLNKKAKKLVEGLIDLKAKVLDCVLCCEIFTTNYPSLIEHIIEEAKLYCDYIVKLERSKDIYSVDGKDVKETELFWNEIMMEHALFNRGLLDPAESDLIELSNKIAKEYEEIIKKTQNMTYETIDNITMESLNETVKIKNFKESGTKGINECEIRSIILPLLADHLLREANHYIRILEKYKRKMKEC